MSVQAIGSRRMSVVHAMVVGAAVAAFLFVLLWATEAAGVGPFPPEFVNMFRGASHRDIWTALQDGMPVTLLMGAAAGAAIAVFANMFRFLDKQP